MADDPNFGKVWLDVNVELPLKGRFYWVSDGRDIALASWDIPNMRWKYHYMHSVFEVRYMLPVKLPLPPILAREEKKNVKAA